MGLNKSMKIFVFVKLTFEMCIVHMIHVWFTIQYSREDFEFLRLKITIYIMRKSYMYIDDCWCDI